MFNYQTLSPNRRQFIDLARQVFPDLSDTISSKQIDIIVSKTGIAYPQWFIVQENRVSRGIYYIPSGATEGHTSGANKKPDETDEEISIRIKKTYKAMNDMVRAVAANAVNSLVIAGGAGLGKSYGVNETLNKLYGDYGYIFHRGYIKATHLFRLLWENRHAGQVIVLDDVDIWNDEQTLNLLKAALELKTTRRIGWGSEKEFEDQDGEIIPRYFDYEGSIIFLTNLKIREMIENGTKNSPHLAAIESRSLVMDMKIKTNREYLIAIRQKVYDEGMLAKQGFSDTEVSEIMEFFEQNFDKFTEHSLRMIEKVARIYRAVPDWKGGVENFCFR